MSKPVNTNETLNQGVTKIFADTNVSMKSGRLTKDAELISEGKFVRLTIANNKKYLDSSKEPKTITNYFNALVSINLKEAFDLAKGLKKGEWVYVKGEDRTKSFETAEGFKQLANTLFAYKVVSKTNKNHEVANGNVEEPKMKMA